MTTMPLVSMDAGDAVELRELLEFVSEWLDRGGDGLTGSFDRFVGTDGYGVDGLRRDLSRFALLLGSSDQQLVVDDE